MIYDIWKEYEVTLRKKEELEEGLHGAVLAAANYASDTKALVHNAAYGTAYKGGHQFRHVWKWELMDNGNIYVDDHGYEVTFPVELIWATEDQRQVWRSRQIDEVRRQKISEEQAAAGQKLAAERAEYERLKSKFEGAQ